MNAPRYRAWRFLHPDLDVSEERAGLRVAPTGAVEMVDEHAAVRQAVLLLLSTQPGERVMRPEYGCELHRLTFSPNDDTTAGLAIHYVRRALERWEPRIRAAPGGRGPQPRGCRGGWMSPWTTACAPPGAVIASSIRWRSREVLADVAPIASPG